MAHNPGDLIDAHSAGRRRDGQEYDFGELLPASISGQVFVDNNGNNALDPGEPLLSGVTIYLLDGTGNRIDSTTTNDNGKYAFTGLKPGVYGVEEVQPAATSRAATRGVGRRTTRRIRPHPPGPVGLGSRRRGLRFLGNHAGQNLRLRVPGWAGHRHQTGRSDAEYPRPARRQTHARRHAAPGRDAATVRRQRRAPTDLQATPSPPRPTPTAITNSTGCVRACIRS